MAAAVQNLYRCSGDDDWIAVTVGTDEQWLALVDVLGRPSWTDDRRFDTVDGRGTHADEIDLGCTIGSPGRNSTMR